MPRTKSKSGVESIQEYADSSGLSPAVDRDNGIIRGVKILGMASKNGRVYTTECISNAAKLYEGARVNVNHPIGRNPRNYQDRIGSMRSISVKEDGLYGDFHFNPKHALAEQLCWDADNAPGNVGFSHVVEATVVRKGGKATVEAIERVESVDLVANPATTSGLFEADKLSDDPGQRKLCEHGLCAISDARSILLGEEDVAAKRDRIFGILSGWRLELYEGEIGNQLKQDEAAVAIRKINATAEGLIYDAIWDRDGKYTKIESKKTRILSILADWESELSKLPTVSGEIKKESTMEWSDITADALREHRSDLVEVLTGTDETSKLNAELTEAKEALEAANAKIAEAEAREAEQAKLLVIAEELKASSLDASNKVVVSDAFMEMLTAAEDEKARKYLIEDRIALTANRHQAAAPMGTVGGADAAAEGPGKTKAETIALL